jgi:hypothetical protein
MERYNRMGYTRRKKSNKRDTKRDTKRGGGKNIGLYPKKNKTMRSIKPITFKAKGPTKTHKSYLKTLNKSSYQKKMVTPDKYLQGILKFLDKLINVDVDNKSYDLYQDAAINIYIEVEKELELLGIPIKDYDMTDKESQEDFITKLGEILQILINEYQEANGNDKAAIEIQMYTLANPIMESIKKTKEEAKGATNAATNLDELSALLGSLSVKQEPLKKNNMNVNSLADLFAGVGI